MNNSVNLSYFVEELFSGDWGSDICDSVHNIPVLCIRGADINNINLGVFSSIPVRFIKAKNRNRILSEGNLVIEISGGSPIQSTGRVAYIRNTDNEIVCSNFCKAISIKPGNSSKYVYYLLNHIYNSGIFFNFESKTTGIKNLLFDVAFDSIYVPKISETDQQKIASVLSALDAKIELNNKINSELEAMAKTIYDYWFVQFDFPDAKGKPYKSAGGKMVWNEKLNREIPVGWEVQKMTEWLDINKSGDWGKEEAEGNFTKQVICFRGADINGLNGQDELKPPIRYILEKNSHKVLKSHDLIIEISGGSPTQSTGRLAFITDATIKRFEHPLICSNFCKPVSMRNKKLLYNFVYYWNSLYANGVFFGYEGKTSGIKNLLLDSFISSHYTVVPDEKILDQFYDIMDNIQEKKQTALSENQKLTELRDWLLPMLMNGQVRLTGEENEPLSMAAQPHAKFRFE